MAPVLRARPARTDRWAPADFRSIRRSNGQTGNGGASGRSAVSTTASSRHVKRPRSLQPPRVPVAADYHHGQEARERARSPVPLRFIGRHVNVRMTGSDARVATRPFPLPRMSIHGRRSSSANGQNGSQSPESSLSSPGTVRRAARMHASNDPVVMFAPSTSESQVNNPQPSTSTGRPERPYRPGPLSRRGRKRSSREAAHVDSDNDTGPNVERQRRRWYTVEDLTSGNEGEDTTSFQPIQNGRGSDTVRTTRSVTAAQRASQDLPTSSRANPSNDPGNHIRRGPAPLRVDIGTGRLRTFMPPFPGTSRQEPEVIELEEPQERKGLLFGSESTCTICLNQIKDLTVLLPCLHEFDNKCIGNWFKERRNCPICRATIGKMRVNYRLVQ